MSKPFARIAAACTIALSAIVTRVGPVSGGSTPSGSPRMIASASGSGSIGHVGLPRDDGGDTEGDDGDDGGDDEYGMQS